MKLIKQPKPGTCIQACIAMAADVPVEDVIRQLGDEPLTDADAYVALRRWLVPVNRVGASTPLPPGWYLLSVPSLNHEGMLHMIVARVHDWDNRKMDVFDPSLLRAYSADGSDLRSWADPITFEPRNPDQVGTDPAIQSIVVQLAERNIAPESTQNPSDQNAAYELSLMNSAVLQAIEKDCADVIGSIRQRLAQWVRESRREQFIATMTNLGWTHPGIAPQCGPEDQSIRSIGESLIPGHIDAGWTLEGRVGINRIIVLTKPGGPIRVIMPDGRTGDVVWE